MKTAITRLIRARSRIPFDMFDLAQSAQSAQEARTNAKLSSIYHRGQELTWDGRKVLSALLTKHGGVHLCPQKLRPLARIFEIILWGELAAWKISAELAAALTPLEAKMAATAQAHDEARHFYVMHDYLRELGYVQQGIDIVSLRVLDLTLDAGDLARKILGMQLMVETMALSIFSQVRQGAVEPVLTELLPYYEKDEARHVGLGTQYLPRLIGVMSRVEVAQLLMFQARIVFYSLASLKAMEPELIALDICPRDVMELVKVKQGAAFEELWRVMGWQLAGDAVIERAVEATKEALFPTPKNQGDPMARARAALARWRSLA